MKPIFYVSPLLILAACDNGGVVDQTVREGVRRSAVEACSQWKPQFDVAATTGLDPSQLCGCAADRIMQERTASDLANNTPGMPEVRAAVAQGVSDFQSAAGSPNPS
jgi:hypothetical protein